MQTRQRLFSSVLRRRSRCSPTPNHGTSVHHRKTKTIRSRKKIIGAKKGKKPKQRRCFFVDCEDASVVLGGAALRCVPLVGRVKVPFDWLGRIVRGRISCSNWTISSSWTKWLGCRLQDRAVGRNRCPSWRCRPAPTCHPASIGWSSAHRCHPIESFNNTNVSL